MRKTLQLIMMLLVSVTMSAQVGTVAAVDGLNYTVTSESPYEVECSGFEAAGFADVVIPEQVSVGGGLATVTAVGETAFNTNKDVVNVTLPSTVKVLKRRSFRQASNLETINLDNVVETNAALESCTSLIDAGSYNNLEIMGPYTFYACHKLLPIVIPSSVTTIGTGALGLNLGIVSINIPSTVTTIDEYLFGKNTALTGVGLNWIDPSSEVTIAEKNFFRDLDLNNITLYVPVGTLEAYQKHTLWGTFSNIVEGTVPEQFNSKNFTEGDYTYVSTSVSEAQITGTTNDALTTITIPATTTYNGTDFSVISVGASAFQGNEVITDVVLPNSVKTINTNAFRLCSSLANINTENVTTIGGNILRESPNVTTLDLSSVEVLEDNALGRAYGLTGALDLPNIQTMGKWCFVYAQGVTEVNIGSSLNSITTDTFLGMPSLSKVKVDVETPVVVDGAFTAGTSNDETDSAKLFPALPAPDFANVTLQVPTASAVTAYEAATGWSVFGLTNTDGALLSVEDILDGTLAINITVDAITVSSSSTFTDGTLSIYDITGGLLVSQALSSGSETVSVSSLTTGVYIVKVTEGNAELVKRFVK